VRAHANRFRLICGVIASALVSIGSAGSVHGEDTTRSVNERLGLALSDIVSVGIAPAAIASDTLVATLAIDGQPSTMNLRPHSLRAPDYKLLVQIEDGSLVEATPGTSRTYRGSVDEIEGSEVAASLSDDGLHAMIAVPNRGVYWLEPIAGMVAGARADQYVIYHDDDVLPAEGSCRQVDGPISLKEESHRPGHDLHSEDFGSVSGSGGPIIAELAADADYDYFLDLGSVEAVEERITAIINTVNLQYERDVNLTHVITAIIVRTSEPDPYFHTNAEDLLDQFRNYWISNHGNVHRDLAQLFTGKTIDGNTIGIAWRGRSGTTTVCGSYGYSVVESNCLFSCGSFAAKTDLSAHELGHNWGADHCAASMAQPSCNANSPPCNTTTMNANITASNQFHPTCDIPEITAYRNTRTCISDNDELRRVILSSPSDQVADTGFLQFTLTADLRYGQDLDVTSFADWQVDRPDAGWINFGNGVFTAYDVDGDVCVTVIASYTYEDMTMADSRIITVIDADAPLRIVTANPPNAAIDARQPSDPEATVAMGWGSLEVALSGELCAANADQFTVIEEGGSPPIPSVVKVDQIDINTVRLTLSPILEPGTWTTITHVPSGAATVLGFLPGDVNADAVSNADDIIALFNALNGIGPLPTWSTDIDRSGQSTPADIITLVDLLNGGGGFFNWDGATLPTD